MDMFMYGLICSTNDFGYLLKLIGTLQYYFILILYLYFQQKSCILSSAPYTLNSS